jgi:hypothetical protein
MLMMMAMMGFCTVNLGSSVPQIDTQATGAFEKFY